MNVLVLLSVVDVVALIAGLAIYLYIVGSQLSRIAQLLEECEEIVREIVSNAEPIEGGVGHINRTGGVVAGALPLLYSMAEQIVAGATYEPQDESAGRPPAVPAAGRRRSRLHDGVGYRPEPLDGAAAGASMSATGSP